MFASYVTNIRLACIGRRYAIAERIFFRASARTRSIPDRRYYAPLKWTGLRGSGDDGGIDSRGKVPRGEKLIGGDDAGRKGESHLGRESRDCRRLSFAVSSYLLAKAEFHVSRRKCDKPAAVTRRA